MKEICSNPAKLIYVLFLDLLFAFESGFLGSNKEELSSFTFMRALVNVKLSQKQIVPLQSRTKYLKYNKEIQ